MFILFLAGETDVVRSVFKKIKIIMWLSALRCSHSTGSRKPTKRAGAGYLGSELRTGSLGYAGCSHEKTIVTDNVASSFGSSSQKEMLVPSGKELDLL